MMCDFSQRNLLTELIINTKNSIAIFLNRYSLVKRILQPSLMINGNMINRSSE